MYIEVCRERRAFPSLFARYERYQREAVFENLIHYKIVNIIFDTTYMQALYSHLVRYRESACRRTRQTLYLLTVQNFIFVVRIRVHVRIIDWHFNHASRLLERNVQGKIKRTHYPSYGPSPSLILVVTRIKDAERLVSWPTHVSRHVNEIVMTREESKQRK